MERWRAVMPAFKSCGGGGKKEGLKNRGSSSSKFTIWALGS